MGGYGRCGPRGWRRQLRGQGYRITRPREAILELFASTSGHLSAEDVYLKLVGSEPGLSLATVYRNLDVLHQLNLLLRYRFGDGKARYELRHASAGTRAHYHLVCRSCGKVIDKEVGQDDVLERLAQELETEHGFHIDNRRVEFIGVCPSCQTSQLPRSSNT